MCWPAGADVCSLAHTLRLRQGKTRMEVRALFSNRLNKSEHPRTLSVRQRTDSSRERGQAFVIDS